MSNPRSKSRRDSDDDVIIELKKSSFRSQFPFFNNGPDALLTDSNPEEAKRLNADSASYQKFKLTDSEVEILEQFKQQKASLMTQAKAIYKQQQEIEQKERSINDSPDEELLTLLQSKIKGHNVVCKVNKIAATVKITIEDSTDSNLEKMFTALLKNKPKISYDRVNTKIEFKLRDRDKLIEGLKLTNDLGNISYAQRNFQGC